MGNRKKIGKKNQKNQKKRKKERKEKKRNQENVAFGIFPTSCFLFISFYVTFQPLPPLPLCSSYDKGIPIEATLPSGQAATDPLLLPFFSSLPSPPLHPLLLLFHSFILASSLLLFLFCFSPSFLRVEGGFQTNAHGHTNID